MENNFHIQWHITERCNLSCIHCYKEPFREELGLEELKFILNNIISFVKDRQLNLILTITGGEPFLKEEIYELVEYANNFEEISNINFISNGTILPKKNFSNLKKMSNYYVSLESCVEFDNDKIRGK
ncbi:MAG: radical SAM protein, partial [Endomicrobiia bacterium]